MNQDNTSIENQEEKQETFWSTMKYLFVQVPKELLGIGYPKSSPPPNEEIKRKCLGAAAGMACTEIKKMEKSFAEVKADARNDRITDRRH